MEIEEVVKKQQQKETVDAKPDKKEVEQPQKQIDVEINARLESFEKRILEQFNKSSVPIPTQNDTSFSKAEFNSMKLKMEEMEQELKKTRAEKELEIKNSKDSKKSTQIANLLNTHSITGAHATIARKFVSDLIDYENDELVFKTEKGNIPLKEGFEKFLKSEEAQVLIPAVKKSQSIAESKISNSSSTVKQQRSLFKMR